MSLLDNLIEPAEITSSEFVYPSFFGKAPTRSQFKLTVDEFQRHREKFNDSRKLLLRYQKCYFDRIDFSSINLSGISFKGSTFDSCQYYGPSTSVEVDFSDTVMANVRFFECSIQKTNFFNADLSTCLFNHSDLRGSDFSNCNLHFISFFGADLRGVKFTQRIPDDVTLTGTKWLRSDIPWWLGHGQQNEIILCDQ